MQLLVPATGAGDENAANPPQLLALKPPPALAELAQEDTMLQAVMSLLAPPPMVERHEPNQPPAES